jgi:hypothetical protein
MGDNECIELKNIKYKSMLLSGNTKDDVKETVENMSNLDIFLNDEKQTVTNEPWIKLDKTTKLQKFKEYVELNYKEETTDEKNSLYRVLATNLDRKKLLKAKDVLYDKDNGVITSIPVLQFNSTTKKFTLKRCEKRQSTLKSLAPKKNRIKKNDKIDINK